MHALKGEALLQEVYGFPSDSSNLCMQKSVALEQSYNDSKALVHTHLEQRPVLNGCSSMHPTLSSD